jgi:RimJ/RimL family protein N-acetyltransferase
VESRQRRNEQMTGSDEHCFAIEADGRYIGFLGLRVNDSEQGGSYRIGIENPEYWGRGYGTEVAGLVLRYAFETLGLHRVHLMVAAYNVRARRCYEKAGFRVEGVLRESFQVDGEWQDDVLMAILREEWQTQSLVRQELASCPLMIRSYRPSDYDQVLALWKAVGVNPSGRDTRDALDYKLHRDPGLFLVAEVEGRAVGTALASWDGRWAWIYRVAVAPELQGRGIGAHMMADIETRLRGLGARRTALITGRNNERAVAFYHCLGYQMDDGVGVMWKQLDPAKEHGDGSQPG